MTWTKVSSGMYRSGPYEVARLMNGSWNVAKDGIHATVVRTYEEAKQVCEKDARESRKIKRNW